MVSEFVSTDDIRTRFSHAMSDMYKAEVPQYGALLDLVVSVNANVLNADAEQADYLAQTDQVSRLSLERHGAIRVGTAEELATIRRLFAVMGMKPVGYYDLSVAGVPVHSTAFRPVDKEALNKNPFRVFTSLLRLELIEDDKLRDMVVTTLAKRSIFTPGCLAYIEKFEHQGGLHDEDADEFVRQALETFRWHKEATVPGELYNILRATHPLIADIVSFKGPHINHLTPRTLDIDLAQAAMPQHGIKPKAVIEGPVRRRCPILLRQTSFLALSEAVFFPEADGTLSGGAHTARFGEIEQRGVALTEQGRRLYDEILDRVRREIQPAGDGSNKEAYQAVLESHFQAFPDDDDAMRKGALAFFRYRATPGSASDIPAREENVEQLIASGLLACEPIVYEDFLPISAAGIFRSNLGDENKDAYAVTSNKAEFEAALGVQVLDELALYAEEQQNSLVAALEILSQR